MYFHLWDTDFGPAFIKVCSYFPYPIKVCLLTEPRAGAARHGTGPGSGGYRPHS